ncbi:organic cation transporter protein-like [Mya arenaria]|uniref:organic cation transporter protein-like n=1 Tax=Mya arenaria TaxID=6604 RepID=UPI0022E56BA5|nr:organic cation transporter protein-like [Mya arenaria]
MKFDDITILLGEFGRYQKILYCIICFPVIFNAFNVMIVVFTLALPDFRCQIPGLGNDTFELQGKWHAYQINQTIPMSEEVNSNSYDTCHVYSPGENNTKIECNSWVYDQSTFQDTFITKFNLVCGLELARANANMLVMAGMLAGSALVGIFADIRLVRRRTSQRLYENSANDLAEDPGDDRTEDPADDRAEDPVEDRAEDREDDRAEDPNGDRAKDPDDVRAEDPDDDRAKDPDDVRAEDLDGDCAKDLDDVRAEDLDGDCAKDPDDDRADDPDDDRVKDPDGDRAKDPDDDRADDPDDDRVKDPDGDRVKDPDDDRAEDPDGDRVKAQTVTLSRTQTTTVPMTQTTSMSRTQPTTASRTQTPASLTTATTAVSGTQPTTKPKAQPTTMTLAASMNQPAVATTAVSGAQRTTAPRAQPTTMTLAASVNQPAVATTNVPRAQQTTAPRAQPTPTPTPTGLLINAADNRLGHRRKDCHQSLLVAAMFGTAFAPNYQVLAASRFLAGFGQNTFLPVFSMAMELVGPSYRVAAGIIVELFWCVGLFILCLLAYFVRSATNLTLVAGVPMILVFLYIWLIPESPRWLISKGKNKEAYKIIQKIAKKNQVTLPENAIDEHSVESGESMSVFKMFTIPKLLIRTLIIYLNWAVVNMVYYGLGLNVGNLGGNIYVNFAINSAVETAAYLLCLVSLHRVGRKTLHSGSMIVGGVACLLTIFSTLYGGTSLHWLTIALSNIGKFGISAGFAIVYIWTAELFPTLVRNSGIGSSCMVGRFGSVICPYITDLGRFVPGKFGQALPLIVFGGLSVVAGLLSLYLPETNGVPLPETIQDAVNFGTKKEKNNDAKEKASLV